MTEIEWFVQYITKGEAREAEKSSQKSSGKNPLLDRPDRTSRELRIAALRNRIARRKALENKNEST